MPIRIQRKRTKGWRLPPNTVSVTHPGRYGNTWKVGTIFKEDGADDPIYGTAEVVVQKFRDDMVRLAQNHPEQARAFLAPLKGKNLACWCKPGAPCHADVLLEIANNEDWVNNPK